MIDAGNRGTGGRRHALPAFFALTLLASITLAFFVTDEPRTAPADSAETHASAPVSMTPAPSLDEAPRDSRERTEQLALDLERALVSNNPQQREAAFNFSLPALLESDPARVVELVARQQGDTRDALRDEVVRLWIRQDREAAMIWMGSLENESERKASATIAMRTLAAIEPAQAIALADQFDVGRDDGSLEHIVQIWATEDFDACAKWLETQPDNAQTMPLRARVEQVREQRLTASQ